MLLLSQNEQKTELLILFFALIFSGCSSMERSCMGINWHEMGRQDSAKGLSFEETLSERQEMCSLDPDSVHSKAYKNGFQDGAREYCNFKTGYIYGFSQLEKQVESCSPEQRKLFFYGFKIGSYMSKVQALKASLESKIDSIEKEIAQQERKIRYSATAADLSIPLPSSP